MSKAQQGRSALNEVLDYMSGTGIGSSLLRTGAGVIGGGLAGQAIGHIQNTINPLFDVDPKVAEGVGIGVGGLMIDELLKRAIARKQGVM